MISQRRSDGDSGDSENRGPGMANLTERDCIEAACEWLFLLGKKGDISFVSL